jgi:uncharacterized low-complexity protein
MASKKKAIGVAVGSAFVAGMAMTPVVNAGDNPFALKSLQTGYMVAGAEIKAQEAKCGGMKPAEEAKCGGMKSSAVPVMPAIPKVGEAKCGGIKTTEAKCGAGMADANRDGKISKKEFMKAHEAMFAAQDKNKDGFIDAADEKVVAEGKCGQGKCGGMHKK